MEKERFDTLLAQVALAYQTTPEQILEKMAQMLKEENLDMIPHEGAILTLEEFVEYLAETLERPYHP